MIFYEAPHKLLGTLNDLAETFGAERRVSLSREMTKLHEQTLRTTLGGALAHFQTVAPKGEFVLVLEGAPKEAVVTGTLEDAVAMALELLAKGIKTKDAVRQAADCTGIAKNVLYDAVLRARAN